MYIFYLPNVVRFLVTRYIWYANNENKLIENIEAIKNKNTIWILYDPPLILCKYNKNNKLLYIFYILYY